MIRIAAVSDPERTWRGNRARAGLGDGRIYAEKDDSQNAWLSAILVLVDQVAKLFELHRKALNL